MNNISKYIILFCILLLPLTIDAKTLGELKTELANYKAQYSSNQNKQQNAQSEINSDKQSIVNKQNEITNNQQKVIDATNESAELTKEIEDSKEELEKLMQAYQLSSGDNLYLEYIFDSTSYEDLVYRYAVSDEIMEYINGKINDYKNKIQKNDELKSYIANRQVQLESDINSLSESIDSLGDEIDSLDEEAASISDQISSTQNLINYYVSLGCKDSDSLDSCASVMGDTRFIRPLTRGVITSYFSYRVSPISGKVEYHSGDDIGGNSMGTNVYSIANGVVGKIIYKSNCGGNMVFIYHTINGIKYTSFYYHLSQVNVSIGQKVTNQTVIGAVGGAGFTLKSNGGWDTCSTGAHLHLGLATGWYGRDYVAWSSFVSHYIDPRKLVGLPSMGVWFYSRY